MNVEPCEADDFNLLQVYQKRNLCFFVSAGLGGGGALGRGSTNIFVKNSVRGVMQPPIFLIFLVATGIE